MVTQKLVVSSPMSSSSAVAFVNYICNIRWGVPRLTSFLVKRSLFLRYTVKCFRAKLTFMATLKAGVFYFALVFGTGFFLGTIRILWLVPKLGIRIAELLEMPFMLIAIVISADSIGRSITNAGGSSTRIAVGVIALCLLLVAEVLIGVAFLDLSLVEVFTKHDPVSGSVYYAMLCVFASMPWLLWKSGIHNSV